MLNYVIYPNPLEAEAKLTADNGLIAVGMPYQDITGRIGKVLQVSEGMTGMGAQLLLSCAGYEDQVYRGILFQASEVAAYLLIDDFTLALASVAPPTPVPPSEEMNPNANPLDIINWVYNSTNPNLSTKAGCGQFTEDCCEALHNTMHPAWGHIRKTGGQNQYNGHAVDAVMLMVASGSTAPGGYDIIHNSESHEATAVCNYAGVADGNLWYYPAAPIAMRAAVVDDVAKKAKKSLY